MAIDYNSNSNTAVQNLRSVMLQFLMEMRRSGLKTMEQEGAGVMRKMYIVQLYNYSPLTGSSF